MAVSKKKKKSKYDLSQVKGVSFTTPAGRLAFPKLFEPEAYTEGQKEYYQTSILFSKKQDLKNMRVSINRAAAEAFGKDKDKWPIVNLPWRDGDEKEDLTGYDGCYYVSAKTLRKVKIVDASSKRNEVTDEEEVYGGRNARLALRAKATEAGGKYYVSLYLQGVQILKGGEPFAGGIDVDDAFGDLEEEDDDLHESDENDDDTDIDDDGDDDDYGF